MPEPASFELDPQRSRLARRFRLAAQVLTGLVATACLLALLLAPGLLRLAAALAAVAALAVALLPPLRSTQWRLVIPDGGALQLLRRDGTAATATAVYLGSTYACLRAPDAMVSVWADALPAAAWRRLRVACRWPPAAEAVGVGQIDPRGDRTK